ncbi:MAG: hypothetical protein ACFFC7_31535 [Candidatus Hermodarchaeota archaeon]
MLTFQSRRPRLRRHGQFCPTYGQALILFNHPWTQKLNLAALKRLKRDACPFCGSLELVSGQEKSTDKEPIFYFSCENSAGEYATYFL